MELPTTATVNRRLTEDHHLVHTAPVGPLAVAGHVRQRRAEIFPLYMRGRFLPYIAPPSVSNYLTTDTKSCSSKRGTRGFESSAL